MRWPLIPLQEIRGTSVLHPFCVHLDGEPVRILLDTKVLQRASACQGGLLPSGEYKPNEDGSFPLVPSCRACS